MKKYLLGKQKEQVENARILYFVVGELGNAGQERQMFYWIQAINKGYPFVKIIVMVLNHTHVDDYDIKLQDAGAKVIRLATRAESLLGKIFYARKCVRERASFTIVISFSLYCNFFVYLITVGTFTKAFGALRSQYSYSYKKGGALRGLLNGFFPLTTISNNNVGKNELENWNWIFRLFKKVIYFSNRLDVDLFCPSELKRTSRLNSVSVGTVEDRKRVRLIIEIIEELNEELPGCIIHTHAGIGPQFEELKRLVQEKGLSDYFKFIGLVNNPVELYQRSHILIHMATSEGTPNVVMEAMSTGLAVVATNAGDTSKVIDPNKNGVLIEVDDRSTAKKELKKLIKNRDRVRDLGLNAREHMEKNYDKKRILEDIEKIVLNE